MSKRVFLHVGTPKSGTTFLQEVLWSQREVARDQGLLLPLDSFFDHYLASLDARELSGAEHHPDRAVGIWKRLVEEAAEWPDTVLVSHELFAAASAEHAERAIRDLGDSEVHVVVTARDLTRQIPAEWQEHVKHRSVRGYAEFLEWLMQDHQEKPWFWRVQDVPDILRRWGSSLPATQVHVVVVPPAGAPPETLWERFAGLLGLDPAAFDLKRSRANTSLHAEQAELLRRVNVELGERLPIPGPYPAVVKDVLAHKVLADRPGTSLALPGDAFGFAVERSKEMARALEELGVHVVGDLGDLVPVRDWHTDPVAADGSAVTPEAVSEGALLREGVAAMAGLLDHLNDVRTVAEKLPALRAERDELVRERDRLAADRDALIGERDAVAGERDYLFDEMTHRPVKHLLKGLSQRWTFLMPVREHYRDARDAAKAWVVRLRHRLRNDK